MLGCILVSLRVPLTFAPFSQTIEENVVGGSVAVYRYMGLMWSLLVNQRPTFEWYMVGTWQGL